MHEISEGDTKLLDVVKLLPLEDLGFAGAQSVENSQCKLSSVLVVC